jgi:carbohydrate kinase (thermoresistant glucokinase family)
MPRVTGLRSPHAKVGRIVVFGRMLDKIRLHARGALPPDYQPNLGEARPVFLDARCCRFLGVPYWELAARALLGGCDEEVLSWAHGRGTDLNNEDCVIWNHFITKLGWRDDRSAVLRERAAEYGIAPGQAETSCELIDIDEGRPPGGTRAWEAPAVTAVIVMGVSGCGKTTVGRGLAASLGWEFRDADDLHSPSNIAKMSAGVPLDDSDRIPWLAAVRAEIDTQCAKGAKIVMACSALKEAYRVALAPDPGNRRFAYLRGDFELMKRRMEGRSGHFMKEPMLRSQFDTLEEPLDALALDAAQAPRVIETRIQQVLDLS